MQTIIPQFRVPLYMVLAIVVFAVLCEGNKLGIAIVSHSAGVIVGLLLANVKNQVADK